MSSTVDNVLNGVELTERVAGDIAHTTPVLKFFIKRTSAAKLRDLVDQVQQHLNEAGNILKDRESKEALYEVGIYQELFDELALRNSTLRDLDAEVKAVRVFNFVRKYTIASKSNLAQLGFELVDGELVPPPVPPPVPVQLPPAMPSVVTLPAYTAHDVHDDGDRASVITDISVSDDLLEHHVHSDTDSIFGNPWLGHVVQALARRLSIASLHSVAGAHLDNDEDMQ